MLSEQSYKYAPNIYSPSPSPSPLYFPSPYPSPYLSQFSPNHSPVISLPSSLINNSSDSFISPSYNTHNSSFSHPYSNFSPPSQNQLPSSSHVPTYTLPNNGFASPLHPQLQSDQPLSRCPTCYEMFSLSEVEAHILSCYEQKDPPDESKSTVTFALISPHRLIFYI